MDAQLAEPAPSPFFPDSFFQYAWDMTSFSALQKCPRYYKYTIIDGWRKKEESVHLVFGLHYQSALELFDKAKAQGLSYEDALDAAVDLILQTTWIRTEEDPEGKPWETDHQKNRDTLLRSFIWHCEEYKSYPSTLLILEDGTPAVELSFKMPAPVDGFLLCGHLDKMEVFNDDPYVVDHKTTGMAIGGYYYKNFALDNQMTNYTIAGKVIFDVPVKGVIVDAAQILVNSTAFSRGFALRTENQLSEWLNEFGVWIRLAENYAKAEYWPMNRESCGNYGGCSFRDICSKDPKVRELFLKTDYEKRVWNPLQNR